MGFDECAALILGIVFTLAYVFMLLKNISPIIKQAHRISAFRERTDLVQATAEVVNITPRDPNGLKNDPNRFYVMRIKYPTEIAARGLEYAELVFAKEPSERAGQNITVLYCRDDPSTAMTPDSRETCGWGGMLAKLVIRMTIAFGLIYAVFYCLCIYGLPDD